MPLRLQGPRNLIFPASVSSFSAAKVYATKFFACFAYNDCLILSTCLADVYIYLPTYTSQPAFCKGEMLKFIYRRARVGDRLKLRQSHESGEAPVQFNCYYFLMLKVQTLLHELCVKLFPSLPWHSCDGARRVSDAPLSGY